MNSNEVKIAQVVRLMDAGKSAEAKSILLLALRTDSQNVHLMALLASVLHTRREYEQALFYSKKLLARGVRDAGLWITHAGALVGTMRPDEAIEALYEALRLDSHSIAARTNLSSLLVLQNRMIEAEAVDREGLVLFPGHPRLARDLGSALNTMGRPHEAMDATGAAVFEAKADVQDLVSVQCNIANNCPGIEPERVRRIHENYARLLGQTAPPLPPPTIEDPDPERKLRVGLLSSDLREHSVSYFIEPLLQHLDRDRFEVIAFAGIPRSDAITERIRRLCGGWHEVFRLPAGAAAPLIRSHRIDILVDLNGNSLGHRLLDCAARPAPVQITYLGYPGTTGLSAFDARLVDSLTDPPGSDFHCTEPLVRMDPCFLCYRPPEHSPEPARAEAEPVTFGSFNALHKLSEPTLTLWAHLLETVRGSRLLIKALGLKHSSMRALMRERFGKAGGDCDRLELMDQTALPGEHLALYSKVDVALDSTPYNGTTTTCEALWMGVPVVTLAGDRHISRVGVSLLSAVGHPEWIASTPARYLEIASRLAADRAALSRLRRSMRASMLRSTLCDAPAAAARFGHALRQAWRAKLAAAP